MKVKEKEPEDQPWIEKILSERWGFLLLTEEPMGRL